MVNALYSKRHQQYRKELYDSLPIVRGGVCAYSKCDFTRGNKQYKQFKRVIEQADVKDIEKMRKVLINIAKQELQQNLYDGSTTIIN